MTFINQHLAQRGDAWRIGFPPPSEAETLRAVYERPPGAGPARGGRARHGPQADLDRGERDRADVRGGGLPLDPCAPRRYALNIVRRRIRWLLAVPPLLLAGHVEAVQLRPVLSGLSNPVYMTNAGDGSGRLFVVEQAGIIKVAQPGAAAPTIFLDIRARVLAGGDRGLLGLAFHPRYATNGRFFVYYTRPPDGAIVIAEYGRSSTDPNVASQNERVLLVIPHPTFGNHYGGTIQFGPDGFLYAGPGDGGGITDPDNNAQNLNSLLGKILRIDVNSMSPGLQYGIPADNPYAGTPAGTARGEIWALGLRNPYRFSFDRETGQLYVGDVGQRPSRDIVTAGTTSADGSFEEIDIVSLGINLGWPVFEGFVCTNLRPGLCGSASFFTPPVVVYTHAFGRCSVTGGYVYRGPAGTLPQGTYVFGDLCSGEIFTLTGTTAAILLATPANIASFGEDEAGELYVVGLEGTVYRIVGEPNEQAQQAFVAGFYTDVLGRPSTPEEMAAWTDFLRANCNADGVRAVARGFFGSAEFAARPLSLADQVTVLYRALLGRDPDPAGLAAWADVLRQARLRLAVTGFIPSAEFRALLPDRTSRPAVETVITRFYTEILGRTPSPAELGVWVDFVLTTGRLETAAAGFLTSQEFETRALTSGDYVTILYRTFLGRAPDPAGLAAWTTALQTALIGVVEGGFLPAAEFNLAGMCGG